LVSKIQDGNAILGGADQEMQVIGHQAIRIHYAILPLLLSPKDFYDHLVHR
jgi:hypothetical protein